MAEVWLHVVEHLPMEYKGPKCQYPRQRKRERERENVQTLHRCKYHGSTDQCLSTTAGEGQDLIHHWRLSSGTTTLQIGSSYTEHMQIQWPSNSLRTVSPQDMSRMFTIVLFVIALNWKQPSKLPIHSRADNYIVDIAWFFLFQPWPHTPAIFNSCAWWYKRSKN
jgi:hypothetical protein